MTSDNSILETVQGCTIEFTNNPTQHSVRETKVNSIESVLLDQEINSLLGKGVIETANHCDGEFISTVFIRKKSNGKNRLILNLKSLNESVEYVHFKMESLQSAMRLMKKHAYMVSIDLRDAYYAINVSPEFRKYLRFIWKGQLYQFTCMPNGLSNAPRKFTKLLKPVFKLLRSKGFLSVVYLDDSYLQGQTFQQCLLNMCETKALLTDLGFLINYDKSILLPTQEIVFLGYKLNSKTMLVSLTEQKVNNLKSAVKKLQSSKTCTIRQLAEVIGLLSAYSIAIILGPLYIKYLESDKIHALAENKGNFDGVMTLSEDSLSDLSWWITAVKNNGAPIKRDSPTITLTTDASRKGWGAVCLHSSTGGRWGTDELVHVQNINYLELKAVLLGLQAYVEDLRGKHVRLRIDNVTAQIFVNKMGGCRSKLCNSVAREIWHFAIDNEMWLTAEYLPGKDNYLADRESRIFHDDTEWMLSSSVFKEITERFFLPEIDLFASRLNHQIARFVSWKPEPSAFGVNAFNCDWSNFKFYAFPPFSVIDRVLEKTIQDKAEGILVVPQWETTHWWPLLLELCLTVPWSIPPAKRLLGLPYAPEKIHPLYNKLRLLVCHVSGKDSNARV